MKKLFRKLGNALGRILKMKIPLADSVFVIGLLLLGYGLYLIRLWLALSVTGLILLIIAVGLGRGEKQ